VTLDPVKQFVRSAASARLPMAFVVNPNFPAKSVAELVRELKANPGKYSYASPGVGSLQHLAFELFQRQAVSARCTCLTRGRTPMMPDIMAGRCRLRVISALAAPGRRKRGAFRTLAVTSPQRMPTNPDWPAMAETLPRLQRGAERISSCRHTETHDTVSTHTHNRPLEIISSACARV